MIRCSKFAHSIVLNGVPMSKGVFRQIFQQFYKFTEGQPHRSKNVGYYIKFLLCRLGDKKCLNHKAARPWLLVSMLWLLWRGHDNRWKTHHCKRASVAKARLNFLLCWNHRRFALHVLLPSVCFVFCTSPRVKLICPLVQFSAAILLVG